jgi:hypothetical protein
MSLHTQQGFNASKVLNHPLAQVWRRLQIVENATVPKASSLQLKSLQLHLSDRSNICR